LCANLWIMSTSTKYIGCVQYSIVLLVIARWKEEWTIFHLIPNYIEKQFYHNVVYPEIAMHASLYM
jgi:hypothetical protein